MEVNKQTILPVDKQCVECGELELHTPGATQCHCGGTLIMHHDPVNHPTHYTSHPSGVECIEITRHCSFNIGNAIKYLWRAGLKHGNAVEDLKKAVFYINDQIALLEKEDGTPKKS